MGYRIILERPYMQITYAYISCRFGNMTISHGDSMNKLALYPPIKPSIQEYPPLVEYSDLEVL